MHTASPATDGLVGGGLFDGGLAVMPLGVGGGFSPLADITNIIEWLFPKGYCKCSFLFYKQVMYKGVKISVNIIITLAMKFIPCHIDYACQIACETLGNLGTDTANELLEWLNKLETALGVNLPPPLPAPTDKVEHSSSNYKVYAKVGGSWDMGAGPGWMPVKEGQYNPLYGLPLPEDLLKALSAVPWKLGKTTGECEN